MSYFLASIDMNKVTGVRKWKKLLYIPELDIAFYAV